MSKCLQKIEDIENLWITRSLNGLRCECEEISVEVASYIARQFRLIHLDGLASMSAEVARALGTAHSLSLPGFNDLDVETATALCNCKELFLPRLNSITPEVARALLSVPTLHLQGISHLSLELASVLAQHCGDLGLHGVTSISSSVLDELRKHTGIVSLGLSQWSHETAEWYVQTHPDWLDLSSLRFITDEIANVLGQHEGSIDLWRLESLTASQAHSLACVRGDVGLRRERLILAGIKQIDVETATALSNCENLVLSGLRSITPEVAKALLPVSSLDLGGISQVDTELAQVLARHRGELHLNGVEFLHPDAFQVLRKHHGPVSLSLREIDREVAEWLMESHSNSLYLPAYRLTDEAAETLGRYQGESLGVSKIDALPFQQAYSLAVFQGDLDLGGVRYLDWVAAAALAQHQGELILNGLRFVEPDIARELAKSRGNLAIRLDGENVAVAKEFAAFRHELCVDVPQLTPAFARALMGSQKTLRIQGLGVLPLEVAEVLFEFENELVIDGLRILSDSVAAAISRFQGKRLFFPSLHYESFQSICSLSHLLRNPRVDFKKESMIHWLSTRYSPLELAEIAPELRKEFLENSDPFERIAAAKALALITPEQAEEYLQFIGFHLAFDEEEESLACLEAFGQLGPIAHEWIDRIESFQEHDNDAIAQAAKRAIHLMRR